jgi:hypothetical protein
VRREDLNIRNRNIEVFSKIRMPYQPHIRQEKSSQIPLIGTQIPHPCYLVEDLLLRQDDELFVFHDGTAQL